MQTQRIALNPATPGQSLSLQVLRFGQPGAGPKALIQAALHADEVPALLVAHKLRARLEVLEAAGQVRGEVLLLPYANPLGLGQALLGQQVGRFDLRDGVNFNRCVPDLTEAVASAVSGQLGEDPAANLQRVRAALAQAASALEATDTAADLKRRLLQLAVDADLVLDLHCDNEALMHLYALTPQADIAQELGAWLQAHAVLLATESGDSPFDEACSAPWLKLADRLAPRPLPLGCFAATVELRGQADTDHALAEADAEALLHFLRGRGVLGGALSQQPEPVCQPTPLAASEPVVAPHAGVIVFRQALGARVAEGSVVADLVCPETARVSELRARSSGVLYARTATRWTLPGATVAKVAGSTLLRTGPLLSP